MHCASFGGEVEIGKLLLEHGAPTDVSNDAGRCPLHVACMEGHLDFAQWLRSHGADIAARDNHGRSHMHIACQRGHLDVARWLLSDGATIDIKDNRGNQPLMLACGDGQLEVAKWLLSEGAVIDVKNTEGDQPMDAARNGDHQSVLLLLQKTEEAAEKLRCIESNAWAMLERVAEVAAEVSLHGSQVTALISSARAVLQESVLATCIHDRFERLKRAHVLILEAFSDLSPAIPEELSRSIQDEALIRQPGGNPAPASESAGQILDLAGQISEILSPGAS